MERKKRVTLGDVARLSGVSTATVSYVLNRTPGQTISDATSARVEAAAAELGYVPNNAAQVLRAGTSKIVLLDVDVLPTSRALDQLITGVEEVVTTAGCTLLVHHGHLSSTALDAIASAVSARTVISLGRSVETGLDEQGAAAIPGIAAHGAMQAEHLFALGHTTIAVALPEDPAFTHLADERAEGVRRQAVALGGDEPLAVALPSDLEAACEVLGRLRHERPDITAIAAYNDDVAVVVLAGARRLGIRVPDDWAVIGVDDSTYAPLSEPALTTIAIDSAAIGRQLAARALGLPRADDGAPHQGKVIRRRST